VQVLNGIVLRWAIAPVAAALLVPLLAAEPSQAAAAKGTRAAYAQAPVPVGTGTAGADPSGTAPTHGDPVCAKARKKLWTESGWIVRRVTLCR
jgi:hypothetical protein